MILEIKSQPAGIIGLRKGKIAGIGDGGWKVHPVVKQMVGKL